MKLAAWSLLLIGISVIFASSLRAQSRGAASPYTPAVGVHTVSVGIYAMAGISHASQPLAGVGGLQGQLGGYVDYARHALRPGIDVRVAGEAYSIGSLWGCCTPGGSASQKLVGPRLSYAVGAFHPYLEGLFGIGRQNDAPQADYYSATNNSHTISSTGIAKFGAFGCDFSADSHVNLRAEYSVGSIDDHGYPIQNVSTGVVFRFP